MERVSQIRYRTTRDERTRCYFCKNKCLRTFIDVKVSVTPVHGLGSCRRRECRSR
jgi:hypothetical protein